ncbi:MAG: ABC transporter ATP-binding protein [Saprospiraceae bacterium]
MTPTPAIRIQHLRKSYGDHLVLSDINLEVMPGQVIGYIGPNGAGKSTTVRILAGIDNSFVGQVEVLGMDVSKDPLAVKKRIGFVPDQAEVYEVLSPREFLELIGAMHEMPAELIDERARRMLEFFDLGTHYEQRMDTFSKGMKQKVLLVSGLLHDPEVIFLDEPLSGLDANSVILVKDIIARLAARGKTIFYCSHMMDVVERVSDRIVLIDKGGIVANGTIEELRGGDAGGRLEDIFTRITQVDPVESRRRADDFFNSFEKPADRE